MAEQQEQQELEQLVEAQARGDGLPVDVPSEGEAPERRLDQRKSKQKQSFAQKL